MITESSAIEMMCEIATNVKSADEHIEEEGLHSLVFRTVVSVRDGVRHNMRMPYTYLADISQCIEESYGRQI